MAGLKENHTTYKVASLVSIACVLQIAESLIPHPIPGLRLGLASMVTLVALVTLGFRSALEIAILRTLLSSFIMGTFMSPAFVLSFSGAVISTAIMGFFYRLSRVYPRYRLSLIGISIVGALSHNITQLYLAYFILIKHTGIFVFFPWLCIGAVGSGWLTGAVAGVVCRKLRTIRKPEAVSGTFQLDGAGSVMNRYVPGRSFLHRLPVEIKLVAIFVLSLTILIFSVPRLYIGLFVFMAAIILVSRTPFAFLISRVKRYTSLVLIALLLPLFFNSGTHVLFSIAYFKVTSEGLSTGIIFASRILFLILASSLLMRTTAPEEMSRGLARLLIPLRIIGIREKRVAQILSISWLAFPYFWEAAMNAIRAADLKRVRNIRKLIPLLGDLIAALYIQSEHKRAFWEDSSSSRNL